MTFWSKDKIRRELKAQNIVDEVLEDRLDGASYRLSVGAEVYVSPTDKAGDWSKRTKIHLKGIGDDCVIPPGQFAFILTEEAVRIPRKVIAFISMRTKTKFRGLVNVSGFHVDPDYKGNLIFAVYNAGPAPVHVARGDVWFSIFFADLDDDAPERTEPPYTQIPTDVINPIAGHVLSFEGLASEIREVERKFNERLHAVERDNAVAKWATALVIGGLIALAVRFVVYDRPQADPLQDRYGASSQERPQKQQPPSEPAKQ